ncbi:phosphotransferase enzyme family protein [Alkalicoccobacillus murimartini]|uniref:Ser/Thr protein kinase RdoA (MazF antagonist) n=1 Tax=Alkalicoccobacillus murimartini TaxID=171685 RepID=A0ABT9YC89_9BACI|nr:phosphotransferase [Alkalicoccobacillus murimartini]MDQ0205460.1 Ser/Thr protein kinase RdoA (MazF antagonist) [Alkalicoccobacillus murimartini]
MDLKLIKEVASYYGTEVVSCLGGFFQNVYHIKDREREYVLKGQLAEHTSYRKLQSELIWMQTLRESGMSVPEHIPTLNGERIVKVRDQEKVYFFVAFAKAKGSIVSPKLWNSEYFELWGRALGKMHAAASVFKEPDEEFELPHWSTSPDFLAIHESFDPEIFDIYQEMVSYSTTLPVSNMTFGIIHNDFHHNNFLVHKDKGVPINFGDAQYNYYFYDLAVSIYHTVHSIRTSQDPSSFLVTFLTHFFKGYQSEHCRIEQFGDWIEQLHPFLAYRRMYSYEYMQLYLSVEKKREHQSYFHKMKQDILTQSPVLEYPNSFFERIMDEVSKKERGV